MIDQKSETMTIYEACVELHLSQAKLRDLIKRGVIEVVQSGRGKMTTVTRASVEEYKKMYLVVHGKLRGEKPTDATKE